MKPGPFAADPGTRGHGTGLGRFRGRIVLAGALSLLAWSLLQWVSPPVAVPWTASMKEAGDDMARALQRVAGHCRARGIEVDLVQDPNGTCLVGPRYTPLFTSLGQLEAKRTSLNPDVAGLLVHLLEKAGVSAGDTVAVGASGSFPGLLVAALAAVKAMRAHPVTILSLGASSYGATRPDFHLLDLHLLLQDGGLVSGPPAAVSLGGEGDLGVGFEEEVREELLGAVARVGAPLLDEADLTSNVARRMGIYGHPAAFVNIGGAQANMGTSPAILEVPAGLVLPSPGRIPSDPTSFDRILLQGSGDAGKGFSLALPPPDQRGVLFEMLARGVPVVHLLHIRGLALHHGLPWDPIPLPEPGSTALRNGELETDWGFWLLTVAFLGALAGIAGAGRGRRAAGPPI